jgi:hypothetical protein
MILCLIPAQFIVLISMAYAGGYSVFQLLSSFDLFSDFLQWLLLVDLFIGLPWVLGIFIGGFILKMKDREIE